MDQDWESFRLDYSFFGEDGSNPGGILLQKRLGFLAFSADQNIPRRKFPHCSDLLVEGARKSILQGLK